MKTVLRVRVENLWPSESFYPDTDRGRRDAARVCARIAHALLLQNRIDLEHVSLARVPLDGTNVLRFMPSNNVACYYVPDVDVVDADDVVALGCSDLCDVLSSAWNARLYSKRQPKRRVERQQWKRRGERSTATTTKRGHRTVAKRVSNSFRGTTSERGENKRPTDAS